MDEKYNFMDVVDKRIKELELSGKTICENIDKEMSSFNTKLNVDFSEMKSITENVMTNLPKIVAQLNKS